jgi:hypothetical protein
MDAYRKFRGKKTSNQGLEFWAGLQFLFIEGLQGLDGKNSIYIVKKSIETNTPACAMPWLEWRQAKYFMKLIDDCINVNTKITDVFQQLEKSNSASS